MQLTVKAILTHDNQKLPKDLTVLLTDTPLSILLEVLKQAKLMQAAENFSVEPSRQGLRVGDAIWQVRHAGKALDLLQSMLLLPEAQQAGTAGFAVEVLPVIDEAAKLRKEVEQLRLANNEWEKRAQQAAVTVQQFEKDIAATLRRVEELESQLTAAAQEQEAERRNYEQQIADQGAKIKQLEQRPAAAGPPSGGTLAARREIDQLKQELQNRQQAWDKERESYEQKLAEASSAARSGSDDQGLKRLGVVMKNPPPSSALEQLTKAQQQWETDRQEYESIIAELQEKIAQLEQTAQSSGANAPLSTDEVSEIEKHLQKKQEELEVEAQRQAQQREELDAMEEEFRNMEVKTARERAEMNRQKADFQRLQRQFDFLLSQATKKPDIEKAMAPVILLREQIRKTTGQ